MSEQRRSDQSKKRNIMDLDLNKYKSISPKIYFFLFEKKKSKLSLKIK